MVESSSRFFDKVLRSNCFIAETQDRTKYFFFAFEETTLLSLNRYVLFYENFMLIACSGEFLNIRVMRSSSYVRGLDCTD